MTLTLIGLGTLVLFAAAFRVYARFVARRYELNDNADTPATRINDGVDYTPTRRPILLAQHFAAIAAAGPIVGPIAAGRIWGWGPALAWILIGAVFIGAVHDFSALVASVRHRAGSIVEIVRGQMGRRAFTYFLLFIWMSLVYVVIAFTDLTARQFLARDAGVPMQHLANLGGGVASASILYLLLASIMGVCLTRLRMGLGVATLIFVPALFGIIWVGQEIPTWLRHPATGEVILLGLNLGPSPAWLGGDPKAAYDAGRMAVAWDVGILGYCFIAAILPLWVLLQPRGYLGGYFLYVALAIGAAGLLFGGFVPGADLGVKYPRFIAWGHDKAGPLFPMLFVTIACGACSGFHGLVCSGTTSKQVAREGHMPLVGYGGMLLEGLVAVIALATLMVLAPGSPEAAQDPNIIYARGLAHFLRVFSADPKWIEYGLAFGMLAFATFIFDTLDVATRLGRYLLEELSGARGRKSHFIATAVTVSMPLAYLAFVPQTVTVGGKPQPAWLAIWPVFGSSNQLLAALTLTAVCVWLVRTRKPVRAILLPALFMGVTTIAALVHQARRWPELNAIVAVGLIGLAVLVFVEALLAVRKRTGTPP